MELPNTSIIQLSEYESNFRTQIQSLQFYANCFYLYLHFNANNIVTVWFRRLKER